ncbi:hypothetical protein BU25DRAFT_408167 [Macroventuria anomochaeta]|uniref:Uncharacterized protein n=1 Tax=Macroventuria anomochaeta TaxID=301207 RepID=A0ACB6S9M0_9PLEO|nr:uncharacterized protein BU25DRAFT_408167 [Macroventuria anomochaeta]KAF2630901.1 hypothetical protein BU25DRAFT_408167 [Macroventuria anomochaeta]
MRLSTIYSVFLTVLAIGVGASPVLISSSVEVIGTDVPHEFNPRAAPADPAPIAKAPAVKAPAAVVPSKTKRYEEAVAAAAKANKQLVPGNWYVFTLEWDLPAAVEGTFESKTELQKLQQKLGFEHVAVAAGQIIEKKTGRGKNEKIDLDFDAYFMDLMKDEDVVTSILRGPKRIDPNTPLKKGQTLVWSKQTTAAKGALSNMSKVGKAYFQEAGHQKYDVDSNNCATFRDAVLPKF